MLWDPTEHSPSLSRLNNLDNGKLYFNKLLAERPFPIEMYERFNETRTLLENTRMEKQTVILRSSAALRVQANCVHDPAITLITQRY
jgi:hypothetical protein